MSKIRIIKIIIDLSMYVLFLLLMEEHLIPNGTHEWLGISLFLLFILHNALNYKWYGALFKGKYTAMRIVQTAVNFLLMIAMIGCIVSAMLISGTVFAWMNLSGTEFGRHLHMISTAWAFILMSIHLGLHFSAFVAMAGKIKMSIAAKTIIKWILRVVVLGISVFGLIVFIQRAFYEELFLLTAFKFLDYEKSSFVYLIETAAMSILFVSITYYLKKLGILAKRTYMTKEKDIIE